MPVADRAPVLVGGFLAGVLVIWIGADALSGGAMVLRYVAVLLGTAVAYASFRGLLRRRWGTRIEAGLVLAVAWLAAIVVGAALVELLPLREYRDLTGALDQPVRERPDLFSVHPLGTSGQALDLLGGVLKGARTSLIIGLGAVAIGSVVGGVVGTIAGYFRGRVEAVVGFVADTMLAFPPLILLIALATLVEQNAVTVALELAVLGIPTYIRLARANTLALAEREFVTAARAMGARPSRVIARELGPNVVLPLLSYSFVIVAVLIVAEASLSFLNVGIQPPEPTWGNMIRSGFDADWRRHPHLVFVPGAVMFATVFAINRVGDALRDRWDTRESTI